MRYLFLVHIDRTIMNANSPERMQKLNADVGTYDAELAQRGHFVLGDALAEPETAITVRSRNGKVTTHDGPFAETREHLGGFMLIEARDLNEAIDIASNDPMAEMGAIEVRALWDYVNNVPK